MDGYSMFARYYDRLTKNVDYGQRAEYLLKLLRRIEHQPGLTLDLACGTGSLTLELFYRGIDIYGIDASVSMLSQAREKCMEAGADILFLCQKMQALDLYGTVDTVICTMDSINHLRNREEVQKAFAKVSFFMNPGGVFVFDVNTLYKHERVLGNHVFVYDMEEVYCVWQNRQSPVPGRVDIHLDFFERNGKVYTRSSERFSECAYPTEKLKEMLRKAGFGKIWVYDEMSFQAPSPESQRLVIAARKMEKES